MIPKIIHYCWFGRNPKPQKVVEYIKQWHKLLPDYEIKEWNEDNFDVEAMAFTREAYKVKKYAFVSDVCRFYALAHDGGIYLDTDVRLIKSFDNFLNCDSFIGKEVPFLLSTAVIGANKDCLWIKEFYNTYENKHFITSKGNINNQENTTILTMFLNRNYPRFFDELEIYDIDYFCAKIYKSKEYLVTKNTIAIHEFSATWVSRLTFKNRLRNLIIRYF